MDKRYPQRKSPRLQGYDYSQEGAYFVTICTDQRAHLFGAVRDGVMHLTLSGEIAAARWWALPEHHPNIELDAFVVMPNHVHGIIVIVDGAGTTPALSASSTTGAVPIHGVKSGSLGAIIGSYKSGVTRHIREALHDHRW